MNLTAVPVACCMAFMLSGAAYAQSPAPVEPVASPLSFNIALTSNYKFRGQDQDQSKTKAFKPALQGGVDYAFDNGFYVGNWNSTTNFAKYLPSNPSNSFEIDIYGGYKFNAGSLAMDVGTVAYIYPGASGVNTTEVYLGAGYGPISAKYWHTISKGYFGIGKEFLIGEGRGTGYFNLAYAQEVMPKLTLKASVGFTNFKSGANSAGLPDYTDYSVGASYDLGNGLALTGALVGAGKRTSYVYPALVDTSGRSINNNTLIVTLTKTL